MLAKLLEKSHGRLVVDPAVTSVYELGSGTGVVGICCAKMGFKQVN